MSADFRKCGPRLSGTPLVSTSGVANDDSQEAKLLQTLQELMDLPGLKTKQELTLAATRVASALGCEKVDAFVLDETHQTLRALGTSATPMGQRQRALGLHLLPLANGGRMVRVFESGSSHLEHHADADPEELPGIVDELGIRSTLTVPLEVNGVRRGVLAAASSSPEFFQPRDLQFLAIVARWVGMLAHRTELAEHSRKVEAEHARRQGAVEMVTVLAHDLRNHLQPLVTRLHFMRLGLERGQPVLAPQVDAALKSVQRLSRLTEDLLDVKRLDEGLFSLRLAPVDLAALAQEIAANIGTGAIPVRATGVPSLVAVVDKERVQQALENLVSNAIRYSPPGKVVEIDLSTGEGDSRCAVLQVLDSGPGIAPELVSTLFERFAASPDSKGLGLGLYLAHRIAAIHSGKLSVHTRPTGGTCFRLTLPLDPPDVANGE